MKALSIGSSLIEITCPINGVINENNIYHFTEKIECCGGHAGNVAYLLGKWGVESHIASIVGSDDAGTKIKKEYENIGVKTNCMETSFDKGTSMNIVLLNSTNKNKTVMEFSSNSNLKKYAFSVEPDLIITDGSDYNATVTCFDKYKNAKSMLMISSITKEVLEIGKFVNYIIINRRMAEEMVNLKIDYNDSSTIVNVYNKIKQKYEKAEIIITLGERGCVYAINGQVKMMPTVRCDIVDTNGAGDVFAGAFIYGMGRDFGLEKSIAYATIAASLSTTKMTSRLSIPTLTEVSTYYDSKFGANNNPNNQNNTQVNMNTNTGANQNNVNSQNA